MGTKKQYKITNDMKNNIKYNQMNPHLKYQKFSF